MSPAKYGQHFLVDDEIVKRIISAIDPGPDDNILEIGPGKGVLTAHLVKSSRHLTAIEIDIQMVNQLNQKFSDVPHFILVHQDFLEYDLTRLPNNQFKIAGNIPYKITSPILRKLSDWTGWTEAILMVQKEVGDRLCAEVGTSAYGALTVGVRLTCEIEKLFEVSEDAFKPPPKVKSVVLKVKRREKPLAPNIAQVQRVIQAAFQQRRKTIENSLSHGLNIDKARVRKTIDNLQLSPTLRAQNLNTQQFIQLAQKLSVS